MNGLLYIKHNSHRKQHAGDKNTATFPSNETETALFLACLFDLFWFCLY